MLAVFFGLMLVLSIYLKTDHTHATIIKIILGAQYRPYFREGDLPLGERVKGLNDLITNFHGTSLKSTT